MTLAFVHRVIITVTLIFVHRVRWEFRDSLECVLFIVCSVKQSAMVADQFDTGKHRILVVSVGNTAILWCPWENTTFMWRLWENTTILWCL